MNIDFTRKTVVFPFVNDQQFSLEKFKGIKQQGGILHDFEDPLENLLEYSAKLNFVFVIDYVHQNHLQFEWLVFNVFFIFEANENKK